MIIRAVTIDDIQAWLDLSHEWDDQVSTLIHDISVFYDGFDNYMESKIKKNEALMAVDKTSYQCLGVVAFSKTNNRISYFGVSKNTDFHTVGSKLMEVALNQLDMTKEISVNVFKTDLIPVQQERSLYESFGFTEIDNTIFEAGVPACLMKKSPIATNKK